MHYFTSFSLSLNCSTQNEPHNPISHFDKDNLHTKSLVLATISSNKKRNFLRENMG